MRHIAMAACLVLACPLALKGQALSTKGHATAGVPAQIVVTVGHHYGSPPPVLTRDDIVVTQGYDPRPVTNIVPLRGDHGAIELYFLVDECSNCEPGSKFAELTKFINAQPAGTSIGIAYIQDGQLKIAEKPTEDRARAVRALSVPTGSKPASPFNALAELIRNWPEDSSRHMVLMISNGIDPTISDQPTNPSAEAAIDAAQRAGVSVYAIYHPSTDYLDSSYSKIYAGQIQLAHVAMETGGEAYFLTAVPLASLRPFLADIADHLANQYWVEFLAQAGETPKDLQSISIESRSPSVELMAPSRVFVPAPKFDQPPE